MVLSRLGTALIVVGLLAIAYGALWQLGIAPGSRVSLPEPVALERVAPGTREVSATSAPTPTLAPLPLPTAAPTLPGVEVTPTAAPVPRPAASPTPGPVHVPLPAAADVADRAQYVGPAGYAVRL